MFSERSLPRDVGRLRDVVAPESLVLDVDRDFETLPPAVAEDLGLFVDSLDPASYPADWLPDDAPDVLRTYAGPTFTVGMPGDGTVAWTRQTTPPTVLVKKRAVGTPEDFLDFLVAAALVEISTDGPEHFLPFFGERYRDLDAAVDADPVSVYQVAAALFDAWVSLETRERFADWEDEYDRLYAAWLDAGERLEGRLEELPREVARGETSFAAATELACSALKHDVEPPAPFAALNTLAYRDHGPEYAVQWAEKTFEALRE